MLLLKEDIDFLNCVVILLKFMSRVAILALFLLINGKPVRGLAIFWRISLCCSFDRLVAWDNLLVCHVMVNTVSICLANVYMPCDDRSENVVGGPSLDELQAVMESVD